MAALQHPHHPAHVADAGGSGLGDGGCNGGLDLFPGHLARQEFLDHHDFLQFLLGQFQPPALFIGACRFLALLDHAAHDRGDVGVRHHFRAAVAAAGDVAVLDCGIDQPQGRQPVGLFRLHGVLQGRLQAVAQ
jgi:hypothetical protein